MALNTDGKVRETGASHSFRRRLALSTALASVAFVGYGREAYAGSCSLVAGTYECSGAAGVDITQTLSGSPLDVTTDPGFGIDTTINGGDAFTLTGTGGLTFTDNNNSIITGAVNGISADNDGGSLTINASGTSTGGTGAGIYAVSQETATGLTITANNANGGAYGIDALNSGSGALTVTATGQVTGTNGDGILARSGIPSNYGFLYASTGTDLTVSAAAVNGGQFGIYAENYGTGALSVTTTGPVIGAANDGILARNGSFFETTGTDITVIANDDVTGGGDGIYARNFGTGSVSVTATGTVTGQTDEGIDATNYSYVGNLTVVAAAVDGDSFGIRARNLGDGTLSVTATGQVTGTDYDGILAVSGYFGGLGSGLTVDAEAVTGGEVGIRAGNFGGGDLSVTATGPVTGTNSDGINAFNYYGGENLTVDVTTVSGGDDGIDAVNLGTGYTNITATGLVEGDDDGIDAENYGTSLTISAAAVTGAEYGIIAVNYGSGALSITATGQVTGTINDGIDAENYGTSLTVIAASVSGGEDGINADNYGNGALSVTATGLVTGTLEEGIDAYNSANGTSLTVSAHDVSGGVDGILAENLGDGTLSVTVDGTVGGGTGAGINTQTGLGGSTVIALNSGADVSSGSGFAISNDAGDSDTTVNTGASVTGHIELGNGSDNLTFDGGNFSGVTSFNGGDDSSAADGFVDKLAFKNVSGSVTGANVINWENVVVDVNGTITFNDNALTAGRLDAVNGGEVSMETGAAENFQLTGDLGLASGGSLVLEIFTPSDFDTFDIDGLADFSVGGEIDFLFDAGFDPLDGLELIFLTALDGISGFDLLDFNFIGLDPLFRATVGLGPQEDELFLSFSRRVTGAVPEPGTLALFGAGLLGLFGLGRRRRRYAGA